MTENPYQSPEFGGQAVVAEARLRTQARRSFRLSAMVLFLPAVYNFWAFDARVITPLPVDLANLCRTANILGCVIVGGLIWFLGVPCLEAIARLLRIVFARGADGTAWDEVLYRSLNRTEYLAIPGAVLWTIWVFGIYQTHSDFYTISWTVGVAAHLLAACWYLPLIHGWYRLAVSRSADPTSRN